MNNERIDISKSVLFENRDARRFQEQLEMSRKKSVSGERKRVKRRGKVKTNSIKRLRNILLCALILASDYAIISSVIDNYNSPTNMVNLSQTIGTLVDDEYSSIDSYLDNNKRSILQQNTYRLENGYAYNHEQIAKDLIKLDNIELFDYAFYSLCNDMGENLNNKAGGPKSNIDLVIGNLKRFSASNNSNLEIYISNKFNNVNTLDEYLIVDNYVDKDGNPDLQKAIQSMNLKAEGILNQIEISNNGKRKG